MKKLFFTLLLTLAGFSAFSANCYPAADLDCGIPSNTYSYTYYSAGSGTTCSTGQGTPTTVTLYCGYSDSNAHPGTDKPACYLEATQGSTYPNVNVEFCNYSGPINKGLIFLVIAGAGLGAFVFKKQVKVIGA